MKRIRRLYPLYFYTLLIYGGFVVLKYFLTDYVAFRTGAIANDNICSFIINVLLLQAMPVSPDYLSWNYPGWSISAELIAYAAFGGLFLLIPKEKFTSFVSVTLIISLFILFLINRDFNLSYTHGYGFVRGVIGFFMGILASELYLFFLEKKRQWTKGCTGFIEILYSGILVISIIYADLLNDYTAFYIVLFGVGILIFADERGLISAILKHPFFIRLGKYSFSIYLNHAIVLAISDVLFFRILKLPIELSYVIIPLNILFIYLLLLFVNLQIHRT